MSVYVFLLSVTTGTVVPAAGTTARVRGAAAATAAHLLDDLYLRSQLSLDVVQLRFRRRIVFSGGRLHSGTGFNGSPELRRRLTASQRLLLDPSLNLTAALGSGLFHLNAAAQLLQHKLARVVVDDQDAVFLVWPLVAFEDRHRRRGTWDVWQRDGDLVSFPHLQLSFARSVDRCRLKIISDGMKERLGSFLKAFTQL